MLETVLQLPRYVIYISVLSLLLCTGVTLLSHPTTKDAFWDNLHHIHAAVGRTMGGSNSNCTTRGSTTTGGGNAPCNCRHNSTADNKRWVKVGEKWLANIGRRSPKQKMRDLGMESLDHFAQLAEKLNLTWWMSFGTLLGSYRHHGMIPWDLDYDVVIRKNDSFTLVEAYWTDLFDKSRFWTRTQMDRWSKIYRNNSGGEVPPQLDVFFLEENSTHMWHESEGWHTEKSLMYPRVWRPFNGRMFPGPRDPRLLLTRTYGNLDVCKTRFLRRYTCSRLINYFPFVRHSRGAGGAYCREDLEIAGISVSNTSFTRSAENIPNC